MKVAIAALLQETNTFSPQATVRGHFLMTPGHELIESHKTENSEIHGFVDALTEAGSSDCAHSWWVGRKLRQDQGL